MSKSPPVRVKSAPTEGELNSPLQFEYGTILVVDDDEKVRTLLKTCLERKGFTVEVASDGVRALEVVNESDFDLVILDVMLPKIDGLAVCAEMRRSRTLPILMLSGLTDSVDKVLGLEVGADDYLTKPFCPNELVARVRALLRRAYRFSNPIKTPEQLPASQQGLALDSDALKISIDGETQTLTSIEYRLVEALVRCRGQVVARHDLISSVWGAESQTDERVVDSHIRNIRRKLGGKGRLIESVRGVGYRIAD